MERLAPLLEARDEDAVFLKGDRELPYGNIMEILAILNKGGVLQVGMVTENPE
jgi:biopolymer transport protein TolR